MEYLHFEATEHVGLNVTSATNTLQTNFS